MSTPSRGSRPHWSARLEDRFNAVLSRRLRERGWRARIEPYTGYGTPRRVRLLGRTLLACPTATRGRPDPVRRPEYDPMRAVRGWRNFIAAAAVKTPVTLELDGQRIELRSDRGGYIDATVDVSLEPGWHEATLVTGDGYAAVCPVQVIGDDVRLGVVSDIDDTVMVTTLPRPLIAAWNAFVAHESARRVVPGMPVLYAEIGHRTPGTPVVYLSTGAWNVAPALRRFLAAHGFPAGPLLLTDWGPNTTGLFRSGREHKITQLRQLVSMFPDIRWLLIGDDGQHDPEIYAELAREHPGNVHAIVLRELTPSEHVLAHGAPGAVVRDPEDAAAVPRVHGPDGSVLRDVLLRHGLV